MDTSWWDTSGAVALITGGFTLLAGSIGYLVRPVVEGRIRREASEEAERREWRERTRNLAADIDKALGGMLFVNQIEVAAEAAETWLHEAQRPLVMTSRFHPDEGTRQVARSLWLECRRCVNSTLALAKMPEGHHELESRKQRQMESHGEASFALDKLIELLGGPPSKPRDSYDLTLRSERDTGFTQEWEKN